jgi:hypothetical protein
VTRQHRPTTTNHTYYGMILTISTLPVLFWRVSLAALSVVRSKQVYMEWLEATVLLSKYLPKEQADTYRYKKFHRPGVL